VAEKATPADAPVAAGKATARLAMLVVDDDRRCMEANLSACQLVGLPRRALIGRTVDEVLSPAMSERLDYVWRAFRERGGHAGPFEVHSAAAGSHEVHISVTANVLPGRHLVLLAPATQNHTGAARATGDASFAPSERARGSGGPTAREREVLALLARGSSDSEIADMLALSPATVQTHVRNAKAKLGARTRAQAVALSLQRGLIDLAA
jgi:PAS domain S-box-containing protein